MLPKRSGGRGDSSLLIRGLMVAGFLGYGFILYNMGRLSASSDLIVNNNALVANAADGNAPAASFMAQVKGQLMPSPVIPDSVVVKKRHGPFKGTFVCLVGVEGVGHHLVRNLLVKQRSAKLSESFGTVCERPCHEYYFNAFSKDTNTVRSKRKAFLDCVTKFTVKLDATNTHVMDFWQPLSFPYGQPRDTLRRIDLIDFTEIFYEAGFDIKYLILGRDPVSAAASVVRRWPTWQKSPEQSKILEDNLCFVSSQLQAFERDFFWGFDYNDFLTYPYLYAKPLTEFLDMDYAQFVRTLKDIRPPKIYEDNDDIIYLKSYFTPTRKTGWAYLDSFMTKPDELMAKGYSNVVPMYALDPEDEALAVEEEAQAAAEKRAQAEAERKAKAAAAQAEAAKKQRGASLPAGRGAPGAVGAGALAGAAAVAQLPPQPQAQLQGGPPAGGAPQG